jgi:hypothetical protein
MKLGRFIPLGDYKNIKMGYGTIDHSDLKTIYLTLNSWVEPSDECSNVNSIVNSSRNKIKKFIYNLGLDIFRPESIVDLDIRTNGVQVDKRSFMNLEITLYVIKELNIKDIKLKTDLHILLKEIVDTCLDDDRLFNFHKNKK